MPIDVQTSVEAGYVYLRCRGTFTHQGLLHVLGKALETAAAEERPAALVDVRELEGAPPTTLERYELGVHVARIQAQPGRRIRLVIVGHEPLIDPQRFGETVAKNRGAIGRVMTDLDEAIAWIQSTTESG